MTGWMRKREFTRANPALWAIRSLALVGLLGAVLQAQVSTSRVTGVVSDKTGAVVAGARVTLTNEGTGATFAAVTTATGVYVFDAIQVGTYTVTVEMGGFKRLVARNNILTIGAPLTVNVELEVGGTEEQVEVVGSFERVQTSTSGNLGGLIDNKMLVDLPLGLESRTGGRNPLIFVRLQPGVNTGANTGGGSHVNGARDRAFNYTLDGIDINESSAGGSEFSPIRTNPDSLQELRVITSNATAEFGRSSGAQVALVTKSGTNEFHGNLFYWYRGSALAANEWGNNLNGIARPFLLQHQFGGDIGGPVIKDRTFFFFNYQGQRQVSPYVRTRTVYTPLAKQGIFRYVVGGRNINAGQAGASVDQAGNATLPPCSATLTTNCIASLNVLQNDPRRLGADPATQRIIGLLPNPNNYNVGDGLNTAGFNYSGGRLDPQRDFTFKIDHKFNDRNTASVRYSWGQQNTVNDTTNAGEPRYPGLAPWVNTERTPRNLAANYRRVINNNLVNEVVAGYNRFTFNFINPSAEAEPFSIVTVNPSDPLSFNVGNLRTVTTVQFVDNLSWTAGAHLVKAGVNFRYQQHKDIRGSIGGQNSNPIVNLSTPVNVACLGGAFGAGGTSGINATGQELFCLPDTVAGRPLFINALDRPRMQGLVNDLLGRIGSVSQGFVSSTDLFSYQAAGTAFINDARYPEYDFYLQDTWRVRPNFTIDLGVRYEARITPRATGRLFRPNQPVTVGAAASTSLQWESDYLYNSDLNNWAPSVGFAWDPWGDGKTSIRANYRLAFDRNNTQVISSQIYNTIPGVTLGVVDVSPQFNGPNGTNRRIRDNVLSVVPPSTTRPIDQLRPAAFGLGAITVLDPAFKSPTTNGWSLNIQREIANQILVDVSYIGRRAHNLFGAYNLNQVDIFNNGFLDAFNVVARGGESPLMNQLYGRDTRRTGTQTGSAFVRSQFASAVQLNSVAAVAADAAGRVQGGTPLLTLAGLPTTFFRPFPQFGTLNVIDSNDFSTYHSFQLMVQRKFAKGVQFQGSYTFSKSLDTRSFDPTFTVVGTGSAQSASSTPFNIYDRKLNYARSDFDQTHYFTGYAIWDLPFGKNQRFGANAPTFVSRLIEGWNVNGVVTLSSGRPFTVYSGGNQISNVLQSTADCRGCKRNMGKVDKNSSTFTGVPGFFTAEQVALFTQPAAGSMGNTGRNFFNGPGRFNLDMAFLKKTYFTEKTNLELRFEFFNITNTPVFGFPTAVVTSTTFGRIRDSVINEARKIRIGAKINF